MIEKSAQRIVRNLINNHVISDEDGEIYIYGMKQFLDFLFNVLTAFVIGVIFNMAWQSILFTVAYIPLRRYAGGYHAPSPRICYVLSIGLVAVSLICIKLMAVNWQLFFIIIAISLILFFVKAPVESKNKPLDDKEKLAYRKYAHIIAILESSIAGIFLFMEWLMACKCVLLAICMSALLLLFSDYPSK